ncbi:MAG TPA: BON domain-containing protein, partial [Planctomycetaceae bacterium]|nr:BON domain-containing protein [Planctomycetaceae bacterium]
GTAGTGVAGGLGGLGGLGGGRGLGGFGGLSPFGANPFGTNNAASAKPSIRTRLVNGVEPIASMSQGVVATGVAPRQIFSAPVSRIVDGYSIAVVDGVATLSGVARSAKDRRMAELVLKLEPGINKIDNRIVVAP